MIGTYKPRILDFFGGIALSVVGITMMLQANVGLEPWSVLQQGMSQVFGISYGMASVIVGGGVIGLAILWGEPFGLGTIGNIVFCAIGIDTLLYVGLIPQMTTLWGGIAMLVAGLELLVLGTWLYMRSGLGAGPRDSLMVAMTKKTHRSVGLCRGVTELVVIVIGYLMGGQVGIGTVISALGLGSLFNLNFHLLKFDAAQLHQETLQETLENWRQKG